MLRLDIGDQNIAPTTVLISDPDLLGLSPFRCCSDASGVFRGGVASLKSKPVHRHQEAYESPDNHSKTKILPYSM